MQDISRRNRPADAPIAGRYLPALRWLRALPACLAACRERARQRHALAALPASMLRDIGVTPEEVAQGAVKPFWRP